MFIIDWSMFIQFVQKPKSLRSSFDFNNFGNKHRFYFKY